MAPAKERNIPYTISPYMILLCRYVCCVKEITFRLHGNIFGSGRYKYDAIEHNLKVCGGKHDPPSHRL